MKCTKCGADLTSEMFTCSMCFSCGCPISESEEALELEQAKIREENLQKILEQQRQYREKLKNHLLTTGFSFEGYRIENYLGIVNWISFGYRFRSFRCFWNGSIRLFCQIAYGQAVCSKHHN